MPSPKSLRSLTLLLACLFASPVVAEAADPGPLGYLEMECDDMPDEWVSALFVVAPEG